MERAGRGDGGRPSGPCRRRRPATPAARPPERRCHGRSHQPSPVAGDDRTMRERLLEELLGAIGEGTGIRPPLHVDDGADLRIRAAASPTPGSSPWRSRRSPSGTTSGSATRPRDCPDPATSAAAARPMPAGPAGGHHARRHRRLGGPLPRTVRWPGRPTSRRGPCPTTSVPGRSARGGVHPPRGRRRLPVRPAHAARPTGPPSTHWPSTSPATCSAPPATWSSPSSSTWPQPATRPSTR